MSSQIHVEVTPPIATVRLDEPERHNVLDVNGWRALAEAFDGVSEREDVTCVVVSGTGGRAFSAGSDIAAFPNQRDSPEDVREYSAVVASAMKAVRVSTPISARASSGQRVSRCTPAKRSSLAKAVRGSMTIAS